MPVSSSTIVIPDSALAEEATDILREHASDLLFNHSMRICFFAVEQGHQLKRRFDRKLLYVAAAFHDFGLIQKYSSLDERFEGDGANVARQFLTTHGVPDEKIRKVWEAITLHTTPGITPHMDPEVTLLYSGVGLDVLGKKFDLFPHKLKEQIVARYHGEIFGRSSFKSTFANSRTSRAPPIAR